MSECPNCGSADYHMPHGATCRINEAVAVARDAERDQIAEWLLLEGNELAVSFESVSPSTAVHRTWQKIRNNEHRSNT